MKKTLNILIVEDSDDDAMLLVRELKRSGLKLNFERVDSGPAMAAALETGQWEIVLSDFSMPKFDGLSAFKVLRRMELDLPFILVSGRIGEDIAVEAMKDGVHDYILKDRLSRLAPAIDREIREAEVRRKRRQAEEALQTSEQRYRNLVEGAIQGVLVHCDFEVQFANRAAAQILGYENSGELIGVNLLRAHIPNEYGIAFNSTHRMKPKEGNYAKFEETWFRTDRTLIWVSTSVSVVDWDGAVAAQMSIVDITARMTATQQLEANQELLKTVFDTIPYELSVKDRDGQYLMVNRAVAEVAGEEASQLVGKESSYEKIYSAKSASEFTKWDRKVLKSGERVYIEQAEVEYRDGNSAYQRLLKLPLRNNLGDVTGVVGLTEDITASVRLYQELESKNRELTDTTNVIRRFVPEQLQQRIAKEGIHKIVPGTAEEGEATVLISDIRSFTNYTRSMDPTETFSFLNSMTAPMIPIIHKHDGFIPDFVGDGIMAVFYAQSTMDADKAIQTAVEMKKYFRRFSRKPGANGAPHMELGIGLNSGRIITGTIGNDNRLDAVVIGETVNLASKMENLTRYYSKNVLASQFTVERLKDPEKYNFRPFELVRVHGLADPVEIFEFFDSELSGSRKQKLDNLPNYLEAIELYRGGDLTEAMRLFEACKATAPGDHILDIYLDRCETFRHGVVQEKWDGAVDMTKRG